MPSVTEKNDKIETREETLAITTTLNIVFNGTMVMGFGEDEIVVIAPQIDDDGHRFEINRTDIKRNLQVKIVIPGNPGPPTDYGRIIDPRQVLMLDKNQAGGMPVAGQNDATIRLPYPERIYPLRLLDMKFDDVSGNGRYAGALVFVYPAAVEGGIKVTGVNCAVRSPMANYSELYILASITPQIPDPGNHHSRMSWAAVANLIHSAWSWASGDDTQPQPKRVSGMDCDVDAKDYPIPDRSVQLVPFGGGNCKSPIAIVTYK
jgi:hypothetical protein